jgi:hypothetical protein
MDQIEPEAVRETVSRATWIVYFLCIALAHLAASVVLVWAGRRAYRPAVGTGPPPRLRRRTTTAAPPPLPMASAWNRMRGNLRFHRIALRVCVGLFFWAAIVMGLKPQTVTQNFIWITLFVALVLDSLVFDLAWESPALPRARSFARYAVSLRDVPADRLRDDAFLGVAGNLRGISNGSDEIGFLHCSDTYCVLHLNARDVILPKHTVLDLTREKPAGDTLAWFGTKVVVLHWGKQAGAPPEKLYLISWGSEVTFGIRRATDRLYERLVEWRSATTHSLAAPPPLPGA